MRGYVYGLLELADRVRYGSNAVEALRLTDVVEEKPANAALAFRLLLASTALPVTLRPAEPPPLRELLLQIRMAGSATVPSRYSSHHQSVKS